MMIRHPHRHPQYVTHAQLEHKLEMVNRSATRLAAEVARQGNEITELELKVLSLEEAFVLIAEEVAVLETLIS